MLGIKDKAIIVTGGCGLIGREIVRELKEAGARVLNADIALETDAAKGTFRLDLSDNASIDALVAFAVEHYGRIDALINSAYPHTKDWSDYFFEDEPYEHFKRNVELQMDSVFYLDQQVAKVMMKQKDGAIVNFGSIYASWATISPSTRNTAAPPPVPTAPSRVASSISPATSLPTWENGTSGSTVCPPAAS